MKPVKTLLAALVKELVKHLDNTKPIEPEPIIYNEMLGYTSSLLAAILESLLKVNFSDWDRRKWIDDSLLDYLEVNNESITISGTMIWGNGHPNKDGQNSFLFEIELSKTEQRFKSFTFYLGVLMHGRFKHYPGFFRDFDVNWQYIINSESAAGLE